jgi:hypothetical protein
MLANKVKGRSVISRVREHLTYAETHPYHKKSGALLAIFGTASTLAADRQLFLRS